MAEGTRLKSLDERLGSLEVKFAEFTNEMGKEKVYRTRQLGDVTKQLEGLGLQVSKMGSGFDEI